jgi:curli biogenesis system outer membrane secretion channel CsgG
MLKRAALLAILLLGFTGVPSFAQVRVAVTPFEADHSLQRYTGYARGELENLIMSFGNVAIVERARMDEMTKELSFGQMSGMADAKEVAKFGKMSGASILVTGSLLKVDAEKKGFSGYGISTGSSQTTATIRVRAYNVEKGTLVYSTTANGSTASFRTNFGSMGKSDEASAAIEEAMKNLAKDEKFRVIFASIGSTPAQTAKIRTEVAPVPENCDIEINGVYQGSTPATLDFAPGATVTIKLSKAGYQPWEKKVAPAAGMRIAPELEKTR